MPKMAFFISWLLFGSRYGLDMVLVRGFVCWKVSGGGVDKASSCCR
jgi:hypothetical protein